MLTTERIEEIREEIKNWKIRCSGISNITTSIKSADLPQGAKTYIENIVDRIVYNFTDEINSKMIDKGNRCEDENIGLYNRVFFKSYKKADQPAENEYMTTVSCDIDAGEEEDKIIDIKSSWTLKTFPKTVKKAKASAIKAGYDWQLLGYMSIFKRKKSEVAYCFAETPEDLCQWEDQTLHTVDNDIVPEELLVTRVEFDFDALKEAQVFARVIQCRKHGLEYFNEILKDHGFE